MIKNSNKFQAKLSLVENENSISMALNEPLEADSTSTPAINLSLQGDEQTRPAFSDISNSPCVVFSAKALNFNFNGGPSRLSIDLEDLAQPETQNFSGMLEVTQENMVELRIPLNPKKKKKSVRFIDNLSNEREN